MGEEGRLYNYKQAMVLLGYADDKNDVKGYARFRRAVSRGHIPTISIGGSKRVSANFIKNAQKNGKAN